MKLYNIYYKVRNEIIEKKNMTKEEVDEFLNSLNREEESYLSVKEIKDREEDER